MVNLLCLSVLLCIVHFYETTRIYKLFKMYVEFIDENRVTTFNVGWVAHVQVESIKMDLSTHALRWLGEGFRGPDPPPLPRPLPG